MTVIAHVGGVPVEEAALSLAPLAGLAWPAARAWLSHLRGLRTTPTRGRRHEPAHDRHAR
jgi:hypothetical protein